MAAGPQPNPTPNPTPDDNQRTPTTEATLPPRLVVAGTHSGVGKTTVATGLLAALRRAGHGVAGAKVGPDFIDPGYHALASGRPPRNLDAWMCGPAAVAPLAGRAGDGADVLVVEGVMGLFDGAADGDPPASTAEVARLLQAPVILVVEASAMSTSVAALVSGYAGFDPELNLAGVILNQVGSDGHEVLLREALTPLDIPVLGALRRDDRLVWRDRHLGLVPVAEDAGRVTRALDRLAEATAEQVDLEAVVRVAATAPRQRVDPVPLPPWVVPDGRTVPVAVAGGPAFTFTYADTLDALRAAGVEPVPFDPARDEALPDGTAGLLAGGGFPEVHAEALAANAPLLADVRARASRGLPIWAECGGLLWLARSLDGRPMAGVVPADGHMTDRLTLGYRRAECLAPTPVAPAGTHLRGHEFHYSTVEPAGVTGQRGQPDQPDQPGQPGEVQPALRLNARWGSRTDGFASPNLLASYLHLHPGGDPTPVERFARACARR